MSKINKILNILKENKKYVLVGVIVILAILYFVFGGGNGKTEIYVVGRTNIEQSVTLSGKVQTSDKADLGFASAGRVAKIFVKNNQTVNQGAVLAQLEIYDLWADLQIKQANSKTSDADLDDSRDELEKITQQENTKVENAYRNLLSEGLVLDPEDENSELDPPTISGIYDGPEGQYEILIDQQNVPLSDFRLWTFNLEKTTEIISKTSPTLLGTRGLYISFSDNDLSTFRETVWYLNIPNKTDSSYLSNLNEYNSAKDARDLAIKNAESAYQKLLIKGDDGSSIAQAEINKIQAEIRKNTIYAPFKGVVTNIEKEVGENASTGERIVSVLGEEKLEIVLQVSELDVSRLVPESSIKISLDAFPGENFYGTLKTVNSRETEIDGVPVYEAFVELEPNERIKTGMSATGVVVIATKENVLAIPSYIVKKVNGNNIVEVVGEKGSVVERTVTLGLLGTDNMVEILSGLTEGENIIAVSEK